MGKQKFNVDLSVDKDEIKISLSDEQRSRIPRVGDAMFVVSPYTPDDDDTSDSGKIKEDAIVAYSYSKKVVRTTALNDDADAVTVNGDFHFKLDENMTIKNGKNLVFTNEEQALDKYRSLMNSSIEEAKFRRDKYVKTVEYLETALDEVHH
jgi:hypothetical protein